VHSVGAHVLCGCFRYDFAYVFTFVLCRCETCSQILGHENRLRVFENMVLRIFGPKRGEVTVC